MTESLPYADDNMETQVEILSPSLWEKSSQIASLLANEDKKISQESKEATPPCPTPVQSPPVETLVSGLPEVPVHQPITRRRQFQAKKSIKEEKQQAKGKGKGQVKSRKGKGKGKTHTKASSGSGGKLTTTLRNSKRRAAKKAKARRAAKAAKAAKANKIHCVPEPVDCKPPKKTKQAPTDPAKTEPSAPQPAAEVTHKGCKGKGKVAKTNKGKNNEGNATKQDSKGKANKGKTSKEKASAKKRSSKAANDTTKKHAPVVDEACRVKAKKLLSECYVEDHGCCSEHMGEETPSHENFRFSVYWNRRSVGVEILKTALPEPLRKPTKGSYQHLEYFSGGPCTQTNVMMAEMWAPPLALTIPTPFLFVVLYDMLFQNSSLYLTCITGLSHIP